jgi:hypothetical protein
MVDGGVVLRMYLGVNRFYEVMKTNCRVYVF